MTGNFLQGPGRSFDSYCASCKFVSIGPRRYLETNISEKAIFPVKKGFGLRFLVLSGVTNVSEQFIGDENVL